MPVHCNAAMAGRRGRVEHVIVVDERKRQSWVKARIALWVIAVYRQWAQSRKAERIDREDDDVERLCCGYLAGVRRQVDAMDVHVIGNPISIDADPTRAPGHLPPPGLAPTSP